MLFSIGIIFIIVGWVVVQAQDPHFYITNQDNFGGLLVFIGGIMSVTSLLMLAWKSIP